MALAIWLALASSAMCCSVAMSKRIDVPTWGLEIEAQSIVPETWYDDDRTHQDNRFDDDQSWLDDDATGTSPRAFTFFHELRKVERFVGAMDMSVGELVLLTTNGVETMAQVCNRDREQCIRRLENGQCDAGAFASNVTTYIFREMLDELERATYRQTIPCPEFLAMDELRCDVFSKEQGAFRTWYTLEGSGSLVGWTERWNGKQGVDYREYSFTTWKVDEHIDPRRFDKFPCRP